MKKIKLLTQKAVDAWRLPKEIGQVINFGNELTEDGKILINKNVPTFEEYVIHLDETLKNDPLMVLAKNSPRSYLYPENNMSMLSEFEIDVVDNILRANGFEQWEKDQIWESGVPKRVRRWGEYVMETKEYPHRFRRCFMKPNSTMYI